MSDLRRRGAHQFFSDHADPSGQDVASDGLGAHNIIFLPRMCQRGPAPAGPFERNAGAAGRVDKHVGARIKLRRQYLGFSVADIAAHCQLPMELVKDIEQGEMRPNPRTLLKLAYFFSVPLSYFFEDLV